MFLYKTPVMELESVNSPVFWQCVLEAKIVVVEVTLGSGNKTFNVCRESEKMPLDSLSSIRRSRTVHRKNNKSSYTR